ncbi:MAG: RNA methyltransferase [Nitrospirae bacterium]|nr:RNA methyltransferase [Nitrospirota bacterium]
MKITSRANPLIKSLHLLKGREKRRESDLFICEGLKLVVEAVKCGSEIKNILISPRFNESKIKGVIPDRIDGLNINVINTTDSVLDYLSDTATHQGIIAVVKKRFWREEDLFKGDYGIIIFLYMLQDPGNLGTIIRAAEAGGVKGIVLAKGTVDLYNPKVVRASMGSIFRMPIIRIDSADDFIKKAKGLGYRCVGLFPSGKNEYFREDLTGPIVLAFGQEGSGLPDDIGRLMDVKINIPMTGSVESLNVAVSAAIMIYEGFRQRMAKG